MSEPPPLYTRSPICMRCGQPYYSRHGSANDGICVHTNTSAYNITSEHALRIQARYALGKQHNPDHDTTLYTDPEFVAIRAPEY